MNWPQEIRNPKAAPKAARGEHDTRSLPHISALIRKLTAIAVPMKVAVAAKLAGEPAEQPPRPLPEVQPPAVFAPKPIRIPAPNRIATTSASLENVRVSQP